MVRFYLSVIHCTVIYGQYLEQDAFAKDWHLWLHRKKCSYKTDWNFFLFLFLLVSEKSGPRMKVDSDFKGVILEVSFLLFLCP